MAIIAFLIPDRLLANGRKKKNRNDQIFFNTKFRTFTQVTED